MSEDGAIIRALTWNVHGCVGRGGVFEPKRVARVLESVQPDISALQEIDARVARAVALDPFSYFADLFGWTTVSARTIVTADGHYGHVLMSRWPLALLDTVDLSLPRKEPRKAIVGTVASPRARITVVAAHLGLYFRDRRVQLMRLKSRLAEVDEGPVIVLGDFNDFLRRGFADRALCPPLEPAPVLPTYPSTWPVLPLDRVWYRKPLELVSVATIRDARFASDHLPLLATLRVHDS